MLHWQREFIAQLKMGTPPDKACRTAAGMSLKEVLDCKESDPEFSNAWDNVIEPEGGRGRQAVRHLTGQSLEALLWSQCSDAQAAAYFNMTTGEFLERIEADPELKKIHGLGRLAGQAQILMEQNETAAGGHAQMQIWLGKQYVGQADKIDTTTKHEVVPMDTAELARRIMFLLEENNMKVNDFLTIDAKATEIIEVAVDEE